LYSGTKVLKKFSASFFRVEESYAEDYCIEGGVQGFIRILIPNSTVSRLSSLFKHRPICTSTYVLCANIGVSNIINSNNNNNNNFLLLNMSIESPVFKGSVKMYFISDRFRRIQVGYKLSDELNGPSLSV
jgi:hypothetical protein